MSATENIARRLADRFALEMGDRLRPAVERAIAEAEGEEAPFRGADPNQILTFAGVAVGVAGLAWNIVMGLWQQRQAAATAEIEVVRRENAVLRAMIVTQLREQAGRPRGLDAATHLRLLEAAAEEAMREAEQRAREG